MDGSMGGWVVGTVSLRVPMVPLPPTVDMPASLSLGVSVGWLPPTLFLYFFGCLGCVCGLHTCARELFYLFIIYCSIAIRLPRLRVW